MRRSTAKVGPRIAVWKEIITEPDFRARRGPPRLGYFRYHLCETVIWRLLTCGLDYRYLYVLAAKAQNQSGSGVFGVVTEQYGRSHLF